MFEAGATYNERVAMGGNRVGKCLPLSAPVMMATGEWRRLEAILPGDLVMAYEMSTGTAMPARVTQVTRSGPLEVFETTFSDGGIVRTTIDHKIPGYKRAGRKTGKGKPLEARKLPLSEYTNNVSCTPSKRASFLSPSVVEYQRINRLPIDPYALGALIGDGGMSGETVNFHNTDQPVIDRVLLGLQELVTGATQRKGDALTYGLTQRRCEYDTRRGRLNEALRQLGLLGTKSGSKFIPEAYLTASKPARMQLLAGLIDTDGTLKEYTTKSHRLALDVVRLVRSLGGKALLKRSIRTCNNAGGGPKAGLYWRIYWRMNELLPLELGRKQFISKRAIDYTRRVVRSIESVGVEECGCITVDHPDHCFIAYDWVAVGNTFGIGCYETALHLTGLYPDWWVGKRFDHAILAWEAGTKGSKVRDVNQKMLLGKLQKIGGMTTADGGMLPQRSLARLTRKSGVTDAIDQVIVRHARGWDNTLTFKSYEEGRTAFEAEAVDWIHLDEEPTRGIYDECKARLLTTRGSILSTLTPVEGLTETIIALLEGTDFL